uniref:Uncharacterized protein n=1 Tax=Arundo donax TaxID=35708 RepID=A0A0A8ZSV2_ARUDO
MHKPRPMWAVKCHTLLVDDPWMHIISKCTHYTQPMLKELYPIPSSSSTTSNSSFT